MRKLLAPQTDWKQTQVSIALRNQVKNNDDLHSPWNPAPGIPTSVTLFLNPSPANSLLESLLLQFWLWNPAPHGD